MILKINPTFYKSIFEMQTLVLSLEERDAEELVLVLRGYHKLFTDRDMSVHRERSRWTQDSGNYYFSSYPFQD